MIFTWLWNVITWLITLFVPQEPAPVDPKIDPNAKCPACGHRNGTIRAAQDSRGHWVQHICKVCGANWLVKPVLDKSFAAKTE